MQPIKWMEEEHFGRSLSGILRNFVESNNNGAGKGTEMGPRKC